MDINIILSNQLIYFNINILYCARNLIKVQGGRGVGCLAVFWRVLAVFAERPSPLPPTDFNCKAGSAMPSVPGRIRYRPGISRIVARSWAFTLYKLHNHAPRPWIHNEYSTSRLTLNEQN